MDRVKKKIIAVKINNITTPLNFRRPRQLTYFLHCLIISMYILRTTRQGMYVWRNIETLLCNHCCSGKARNITYYECLSLVLVTQHAMRMHHIAICGLSGPTTFFHIISQTARFSKKNYRTQIVYFHFVYNVSHSTKNGAKHDQKRVKYPLFLSDFNETWVISTNLRKTLKYQLS